MPFAKIDYGRSKAHQGSRKERIQRLLDDLHAELFAGIGLGDLTEDLVAGGLIPSDGEHPNHPGKRVEWRWNFYFGLYVECEGVSLPRTSPTRLTPLDPPDTVDSRPQTAYQTDFPQKSENRP